MTRQRTLRLIILFYCMLTSTLIYAFTETGMASWYGGKFQGRETASGEIFDTNNLTAAHKTLPFGTMVKVVNIENEREIVVRINDRGPFVAGRIIDLSRAAANELEMVGAGVANVCIEVVSSPVNPGLEHKTLPAEGRVIIQIGSFGNRQNAVNIRTRLSQVGITALIEDVPGGISRVIIPDVLIEEADSIVLKLTSTGFGSPLIRRSR